MKATVYLHSSKDNMGDKAEELNLSENAAGQFRYALSEVKFDLDVNEETGMVEILAVDGRKLGPIEDVYPEQTPSFLDMGEDDGSAQN